MSYPLSNDMIDRYGIVPSSNLNKVKLNQSYEFIKAKKKRKNILNFTEPSPHQKRKTAREIRKKRLKI